MKIKQLLLTAVLATGLGGAAHASTLVEYTFTGEVATPAATHPFVSGTEVDLSAGSVAFEDAQATTWTGSGVPYAQGKGGWAETDQSTAKHFAFTLNELNGATFTPTNISFLHRATGAGPSALGITVNGSPVHSENVADSDTVQTSFTLAGFDDLTSVTILIQGWDNGSRSTGGGGDFRIDDVLVEGTVDEPAGEFPPTVGPPTRDARTDTTLTLSANINATGGPDVTERGFYYNLAQGFTPPGEGTKVSETGTFGTGIYSLTLNGLDPDTEYYVQAFATNPEGTGFSTEASFVTLKSPPPDALAFYTFTDSVLSPEISHPEVDAADFDINSGSVGFGTASAPDWLAAGAEVPYADGGSGWTATDQASAKHFIVELTAVAGKAMTITNISLIHRRTGAGPKNTGISINGASVHAAPLAENVSELLSVPIVGFGNLTSAVVRIEAWNADSTGPYRADNVLVQGFVDDEVIGTIPPTVSTPTSADLDGVTATLGGTIDGTGDTTVVERGIYWSTIESFDPELDGTKVSEAGSFSTGAFTVSVTDLAPESTIYFVAFARNAAGSGFSSESSFLSGEAPPELPTVTTPTATDIGETSASLGADIESDGGDDVTRRGVVWSTMMGFDPELEGSVIDEVGTFAVGPFSVSATGLDPATRVYFRAFAENAVGIGYSDEAVFFTTPADALAFYAFTGDDPSPQTVATGVTATPIEMSTGSPGFASANAATWTGSGVPYVRSTGGWTAGTQEEAKYFEIELTAGIDSVMTITNITLLYRSTGNGPSAVGVTLEGTGIHSENALEDTTTEISIPLVGYEDLAVARIRIQGWDNASRVTSGGGDLQLDDILVQGFVDEGTPPPDGPAFDDFFFNDGVGRIEAYFFSEPAVVYALEYTTDLTETPEPVWTEADTAIGNGAQIQLFDADPADPMRIYRIIGN